MHKSDDPWERESRGGCQQDVPLDGQATGADDLGAQVEARQSLWRRLLNWLINISPLVLTGASAFLVLYLLAKLFRLR